MLLFFGILILYGYMVISEKFDVVVVVVVRGSVVGVVLVTINQ